LSVSTNFQPRREAMIFPTALFPDPGIPISVNLRINLQVHPLQLSSGSFTRTVSGAGGL
jgi:hypothetical protein